MTRLTRVQSPAEEAETSSCRTGRYKHIWLSNQESRHICDHSKAFLHDARSRLLLLSSHMEAVESHFLPSSYPKRHHLQLAPKPDQPQTFVARLATSAELATILRRSFEVKSYLLDIVHTQW